MTVCNMSIEAGARAGLVAPDDKTFAYVKGRPYAPKGARGSRRSPIGSTLPTDPGANYDKEVASRRRRHRAARHLGHQPRRTSLPITGRVPDPAQIDGPAEARRRSSARCEYMALTPDTPLADMPVQRVFIGSCTNSRIEDLRAAAAIAKGRKVADGVARMVVPGSGLVKHQAEEEGLDRDLPRSRLRMARAGLLDVPVDERRQG